MRDFADERTYMEIRKRNDVIDKDFIAKVIHEDRDVDALLSEPRINQLRFSEYMERGKGLKGYRN
jgi:hypothetical protein